MFYAKMNEDDDELPRYEEEEEGLEQPQEGELVEEGEETVIEVGTGEEEPEAPTPAPPRRATRPAKKKAAKPARKKKAKAKPRKKAAKKSAKKSARRKKR